MTFVTFLNDTWQFYLHSKLNILMLLSCSLAAFVFYIHVKLYVVLPCRGGTISFANFVKSI